MALSEAVVNARIDALELAMATGQLEVSYADKTVRYRTFDEMERALGFLKRKRDELTGTGRSAGSRQIRIYTGDGYGS